jgi:ornithine carbamoyltransferase
VGPEEGKDAQDQEVHELGREPDPGVLLEVVGVAVGMEAEKEQRIKTFSGYTVDQSLMNAAAPEAVFLHCLPAYRGYEVSAEVIDGPKSLIWDEAENRLHAQKALMVWLARKA